MFNISSFLEKFSKNILSQEANIKTICTVVFDRTGIVCDPKSVKIQNGILYLDISPAQKNKIFINKKMILENFSDIIPKIKDIR
jgi:hypothetical protein